MFNTLTGHNDFVKCLILINDSTIASASGGDSSIKIWNSKTNQCINTLTGHNKLVYCLILINDSTIASGVGINQLKSGI